VILSTVATIPGLQQYASEGLRTQHQCKRSNTRSRWHRWTTKGRSHTSIASTSASNKRWVTDICLFICSLLEM